MKGKNIVIGLLIVAVIVLGYFLLKNKPTANNESASGQDQSQAVTPPPAPIPTEIPAPSPEPPPAPNPGDFKETFAEYNWLVDAATLDGKSVNMNADVPAALTLNFDMSKKTYSGFAGCNDYSGAYKAAAPNGFSFGATVSTKKFCADSADLENDLFAAMGKITKFAIQNGVLVLSSADGKTTITYKMAI
jgi:putative lipoprotein